MTPSGTIAASGLLGVQQARISHVPAYASTAGDEAIALGRLAGIELDPWQQIELRHAMGESVDWKCRHCTYRSSAPVACPVHPGADLVHPWAAFEVVDVDPRQNGKSEKLVVRQLAGLFLLEEPLQIYSAHLFDTSMEIFRRLVFVVENCDDLRREVKHRGSKMVGIKYSHGEEGIELRDGRRIRFKARTAGGGRGFSCDCLYLDEAMILPERFLGATVPTLSARANPQIWFAGSAPDKDDPAHDGVVLSKRRKRATAGDDPSLAYFEHSAEGDDPETVSDQVLDDPAQWALANPGLGIRITPEYVANERRAMGRRQFAVERLGIGAWPDPSENGEQVISDEDWDELQDLDSRRVGQICVTFDVTLDRQHASIAIAGHRADGLEHVEIVEHREGTGWLVDRVVELEQKHSPEVIACDGRGPAASFVDDLANRGVRVDEIDAQNHAQACGSLVDAVAQKSFRHLGTPEMRAALKGAGKRSLGDAWAWSRKTSTADICPLVAFTLARRKAEIMRESVYEDQGLLIA